MHSPFRMIPLALLLFVSAGHAASGTPFSAGHKSVCLAYDQVAFDPKEGDSLQYLVDVGFFPPGVDFAVSQLAYSLRTPKAQDPVSGSSRLLLNQVWYPIRHEDADSGVQTTHVDFIAGKDEDKPLGTALSQIINIGGAFSYTAGDYPNAPEGYGLILGNDAEVASYIVDAPAGSTESAPIAASEGPFPIIILDSPGHDQFGIAEQLAARGYIVIAPTHPNDQFYDGIVAIGSPELDGLPAGGIPYGLNCDDSQINAAKPVNGILDFNSDITDVWLAEDGIYLGTLNIAGDIQRTLQLRAIDIGILIERAGELFTESGVVNRDKVGVLGFSLGGNTAQLIVSDDSALANSSVVPAQARAGLDRVDAVVTLAGNNRFQGGSSLATQIEKPTLALQGRQDQVVNLGAGSRYEAPTLVEPNPVFADNYQNRYAPKVPAMRVLIDRFDHSDFMSSEPLRRCIEHGGSDQVPDACLATRPIDERFDLVEAAGGGLELGGSFIARPLEERTDIATLYTAAWFDLYVKQETCTPNTDLVIDGRKVPARMNNLKRLTKNHFKQGSIDVESRDLLGHGSNKETKKQQHKPC